MPLRLRVLLSLGCCAGALVTAAPVALAADSPGVPPCDSMRPDVQPPDCAGDGSSTSPYVVTDTGDPGGGVPSGFVALFVVVGLAGAGLTAWRVSTARDLARASGMDPDQAAAITLLGNDGLDAAYVASSVRAGTATASEPRSAHDRLVELQELRDQGLITEAELATRRAAVVDAI